jgi:hypothetical protein
MRLVWCVVWRVWPEARCCLRVPHVLDNVAGELNEKNAVAHVQLQARTPKGPGMRWRTPLDQRLSPWAQQKEKRRATATRAHPLVLVEIGFAGGEQQQGLLAANIAQGDLKSLRTAQQQQSGRESVCKAAHASSRWQAEAGGRRQQLALRTSGWLSLAFSISAMTMPVTASPLPHGVPRSAPGRQAARGRGSQGPYRRLRLRWQSPPGPAQSRGVSAWRQRQRTTEKERRRGGGDARCGFRSLCCPSLTRAAGPRG